MGLGGPALRRRASWRAAVARREGTVPVRPKTRRPTGRAAAAQQDELRAGSQAVRLTHPERVLFCDPIITKQDLAQFYRSIAGFILPELANRPLMLLRCPRGADGECFFQKHMTRGFPNVIHEISDSASRQLWMYVDGLEGLIGLVQMNALEYHVWESTVANLDRADRLVFDLDPAPGLSWGRVIQGALALRARLSALHLQCFVRTSGGKGLHVVVPIRPATDWETARGFARALAEDVARDDPQRFLATASKAERRGRIFIDYLRNARGSTAVCSYSLRNRPGAPIATPLSWEELPRIPAPDHFRFGNIRRRLARLARDPWEGIDRLTQALPDPDG